MNTQTRLLNRRSSRAGFTLVEIMISTLIIGLLVAMAVPAYNSATTYGKVASVRGSVDSMRSAIKLYLDRPNSSNIVPLTRGTVAGTVPVTGTLGSATPTVISNAATLDTILRAEGFQEKPITIKYGGFNPPAASAIALAWNPATSTFSTTGDVAPTADWSTSYHAECRIVTASSTPATAAGANFRLDGVNSLPDGARVQYLVIPNMPGVEAANLANSLNNMTSATASAANNTGPVVYNTPDVNTKLTTVYLYIAHQS